MLVIRYLAHPTGGMWGKVDPTSIISMQASCQAYATQSLLHTANIQDHDHEEGGRLLGWAIVLYMFFIYLSIGLFIWAGQRFKMPPPVKALHIPRVGTLEMGIYLTDRAREREREREERRKKEKERERERA